MKLDRFDDARCSGGTLAVCRRLLVALVMYLAASPSAQSKLTPRRFDDPSGTATFDGATVDRETGDVFLASTLGVLYHLTEDLRLVDAYHSPSSRDDSSTRLLELIHRTDREKIDAKRKEFSYQKLLLFCGNDLCEVVDVSGERIRPVDAVFTNDSSSSSELMLFVPNRQPSDANSSAVAMLYSATGDDRQPTDSDTLTAMVLDRNTESLLFSLRHRGGIQLHSDGGAGVRYIYAFDDGQFAYFVFLQPVFDGSVETRLARVCVDDEAFYSYTELAVLCRRRPTFQTYFEAAVAAVVAPMGAALARRLGDRAGADRRALYIAMGGDQKDDNGYGVCVYPLVDVRHEFAQAQRDCYRGSGRILASVDTDERKCTENVS